MTHPSHTRNLERLRGRTFTTTTVPNSLGVREETPLSTVNLPFPEGCIVTQHAVILVPQHSKKVTNDICTRNKTGIYVLFTNRLKDGNLTLKNSELLRRQRVHTKFVDVCQLQHVRHDNPTKLFHCRRPQSLPIRGSLVSNLHDVEVDAADVLLQQLDVCHTHPAIICDRRHIDRHALLKRSIGTYSSTFFRKHIPLHQHLPTPIT